MKLTIIAVFFLTACFSPASSPYSSAQQRDQLPQAGNFAPAIQSAVVKKVGFRMTNWQTIHHDGTPATQERIATLQRIGCEVREDNHGGHVDIGFRCVSWKSIPAQNDDQQRQWHAWLVNNEFETVLLNPPANSPLPAVGIRLLDWKTIHADNAEQAQSLKETYELIGCEVTIDNHGDHIDAKIRCANGATLGLVNSQSAHVWQEWLNKSGFETQHDHSADGVDAHAGHDHTMAAQGNAGQGQVGHEGHDHATGDHAGHDHH